MMLASNSASYIQQITIEAALCSGLLFVVVGLPERFPESVS